MLLAITTSPFFTVALMFFTLMAMAAADTRLAWG